MGLLKKSYAPLQLLGKGLSLVKSGFVKLTAVMVANPFVALAAAVIGVSIALVALYKHNKKFRKFVNGIAKAVSNFTKKALKGIKKFFSNMKKSFSSFGKSFKKPGIIHGNQLINSFLIFLMAFTKFSNLGLKQSRNIGTRLANYSKSLEFILGFYS
ncbi:hypothetical protein S100892_01157 [Pediococcus pentosaceus]|uniref:Uncharacterized protein n=1 Tax=Pediococcus pentosaceus TaxID=1255 RepID=A0A1Y0VNM4_PEDPE|nr:hypothetical protein S100892_01157 [Pediococcus pentosaceus]